MAPINYVKAVERMIEEFYKLSERRYCGDYDAVLTIVDLLQAVSDANLTDRQKNALWLIAFGLKQEEAAEMQGISQQMFSRHYLAAIRKIAKIYASNERR